MTNMFVKVLLDASGSMYPAQGVTIRGLNEYLHGLDREATVSVARFASPYGVKRIHTNVKPAKAQIGADDYPCLGGTPLYDAIGTTIQEIDTEAKEFDRVVLVIQTDGMENESKEFKLDQIKQLLADKQQGEGWLVVFLGASVEAMQEAATMGIATRNSLAYNTSNSPQAFAGVSRNTRTYGASGQSIREAAASSGFNQQERDKAK